MIVRTHRPASSLVALAVACAWVPALTSRAALAEDPCALLALREVRGVYPDAQAGVFDAKLAKDGVFRCTWKHGAGTLFLVTGSADDDTVADEAESWSLTILDPLRDDAARQVRYETVRGVGDEAVAVVERRDASKGFTQDGAYISVRRGRVLVTVLAPDLARGDRAAALKTLAVLANGVTPSR